MISGAVRRKLEQTLSAAYADGLISEQTLTFRTAELSASRLIDVKRLVGDLRLRRPRTSPRERMSHRVTAIVTHLHALLSEPGPVMLLALDPVPEPHELTIGRDPCCDVVLSDPSVSRRHARVMLRQGRWVLQDLASTNGTLLNGRRVGRCEVRPGDRLSLGKARLRVD